MFKSRLFVAILACILCTALLGEARPTTITLTGTFINTQTAVEFGRFRANYQIGTFNFPGNTNVASLTGNLRVTDCRDLDGCRDLKRGVRRNQQLVVFVPLAGGRRLNEPSSQRDLISTCPAFELDFNLDLSLPNVAIRLKPITFMLPRHATSKRKLVNEMLCSIAQLLGGDGSLDAAVAGLLSLINNSWNF